MQIESPSDIVLAYANQALWLERRLEKLKQAKTLETDPVFVNVKAELLWCRTAHDRMQEIINVPKGYWVQVLKSKVVGLEGKVGMVTYVNLAHNFAAVQFNGDPKPRNLGLSNLQVINLPVPSVRVPCEGMAVHFQNDTAEYVAIKWDANQVFVEPKSATHLAVADWDRYTKRVWKDRTEIRLINGVAPL